MPPPQQLLSSGVSSIRWLNARCQSSVVVLVFFILLVSLPLRSSSPSSSSLSPSTDAPSASESDPFEPCPAAQEWINLHGFFCFTLMNSTYLTNKTELRLREPRAIQMFCEMDRILEKIDCDQPFSVNVDRNQCNLCREAFRDWSCSMLTDTTPEGLIDCARPPLMPCPSCASICHRVMRLCPYLSPDRVQGEREDGKQLPHVSQYGGHPAFYCPEETIHPSDPAYPSVPKSHYYYSHDHLIHDHNHYLSVCHEPHPEEFDPTFGNQYHTKKRHADSGPDESDNHQNNDVLERNGNDDNGKFHDGPENYYTSCCWAYAPGSALEDSSSDFISTSSLKSAEPDWSAHVSAYDTPSYSSKEEYQRQSDTRVILNCCDGNGDCKVSDRDITSSQQSHRQKLANDDDEDNKPHLEKIKKGRTSRSRSSNIDTYGSDTRYRERVSNSIDENNEDGGDGGMGMGMEGERDGRDNDLLFLGGAAAEPLSSPRRSQSDVHGEREEEGEKERQQQPVVPTTSIDYEDELLLDTDTDTDSDIDSDSDNEIEGGSSSSTESEDLLTTDLELDDGDDYHRHSRRSNIDINGRSVIISSSSATNTKHKNSLHKNNMIAPSGPTVNAKSRSHNSNYNSRQQSNTYLSSLQQHSSNVNINTRFQNNDYKIHHSQKDEFMTLVMGDRRVSPFKSDPSGLMKNAALRPVRAAAKSGKLATPDGVKVSSDAGTSSTFMTMAFASSVYPAAPSYKWGTSYLTQSQQWSSNSVLLSLPMKTFSTASSSSSAPSHTIHHDCCSSLLFLLLLLIFTTTNFLPIYYLLGFSTTDTCATMSSSSRTELRLRRKTNDKCKAAKTAQSEMNNEDADIVDTKSIATKNTLDYYLYRASRESTTSTDLDDEKVGVGVNVELDENINSASESSTMSRKSRNVRKLLACYLTEKSQNNTFALLLQKLQQLSVMNLRLQLIWTLKSSRQLVIYKFLRITLKVRRPTVSTFTLVGENLLCPLPLQLLQNKLLLHLLVVFLDLKKRRRSQILNCVGTYYTEIPITIMRTLRHISDKKTSRRNCRVLLVVLVLSLLFLRRKRRIMRQKQYHTEFYYNNYLKIKTSTISDDYSKLSQLITNYKQNKDLIQIETTTNVTTTTTNNNNNTNNNNTTTNNNNINKPIEYRYDSIIYILLSVHLLNDFKNPKGLLHLFNTDTDTDTTITTTSTLKSYYYYDDYCCCYYYYITIHIHNHYIVVHYSNYTNCVSIFTKIHYISIQSRPGGMLVLEFNVTSVQLLLLLLLLLLLRLTLTLRRCETKFRYYYGYESSWYYNKFYFYSYDYLIQYIPSHLLVIANIEVPFVTRQYYLYYHNCYYQYYPSNCSLTPTRNHPFLYIVQLTLTCATPAALSVNSEPAKRRGNPRIRLQNNVFPSYFHLSSRST